MSSSDRLTRDRVTAAARIMLPTYAVMFGVVGLLFVFQDSQRTSAPSFNIALSVMSIRWWGLAFLLIAFIEAWALLLQRRKAYLTGLVLGAGMCGFWAILLLRSAQEHSLVSWTSAVWVGGWVAAHIASARSLARGER